MNEQTPSPKIMFERPNINQWHALSHEAFLEFVNYIFQRAGYKTEPYKGHGADLSIYEGKKLTGYVAVQSRVAHVGGGPIVQLAGVEESSRVPHYFITTGDFATPAYTEAKQRPQIKLVNGTYLKRYVDYLYGIRFEDSSAPPTTLSSLFEADDSRKKIGQPRTQVLVVANNKGGVGKTTTAFNICYGLMRAGKKVLAVDFDPQANLTLALLSRQGVVKLHLGHHIEDQKRMSEMVYQSQFENISTIPAHPSMRLAFINMSDWYSRELDFAEQVLHRDVTHHPLVGDDGIDWIVIDTPPDMGFFTRCALAASHYVLIPIAPEMASVTGTSNIVSTIQAMEAFIGSELRVQMLGAFFTKWENTARSQERGNIIASELIAASVPILETIVRDDGNIQRGYDETVGKSQQRAIDLFAREGHAGEDYQKLVKEILDRVSYP